MQIPVSCLSLTLLRKQSTVIQEEELERPGTSTTEGNAGARHFSKNKPLHGAGGGKTPRVPRRSRDTRVRNAAERRPTPNDFLLPPRSRSFSYHSTSWGFFLFLLRRGNFPTITVLFIKERHVMLISVLLKGDALSRFSTSRHSFLRSKRNLLWHDSVKIAQA